MTPQACGRRFRHDPDARSDGPRSRSRVISRVNDDDIGGGFTIVSESDLLIAHEVAKIMDHHRGMGRARTIAPPFGRIPGDGGVALAPLDFSPSLDRSS